MTESTISGTIGKSPSLSFRTALTISSFYDTLMLEQEYSLDQEAISEYFPLETSIRGMLQIFEEIFGLVFVQITGKDRDAISETGKGDDIVWHPDVQVFSVWDDEGEGSGFVGYLYLDLHPRDGKYGHAANFNLQPGYIDENGKRRYPATALVCNFSKPTPKKPSLLKHDEVVTLFHEVCCSKSTRSCLLTLPSLATVSTISSPAQSTVASTAPRLYATLSKRLAKCSKTGAGHHLSSAP